MKKTTTKKKTVKKTVFLSREELDQIQIQTLERNVNKLEIEKLNLQIKNSELTKENMILKAAHIENDIHGLKNSVMNKSQFERDLKSKYSTLITELTKKYSLPKHWGIDPETGEVILKVE